MGRIFAFITFLSLTTIIIMGLASPNDPLFLFAANGPAATIIRLALAVLMLGLAFGYGLRWAKLKSYLGLAGFSLITLGVLALGVTQGSGVYPYLQPADLLTAIVIGVTFSIVTLETRPAASTVIPDRYFFYQEAIDNPLSAKRLEATGARQKTA